MSDQETVQEAWVAYLKSKTQLTSLLDSPLQIKQLEYQGDEYKYPAVRVSVDYFPSINGCGPDDIDVFIDVFSEQKSAKEALHIGAVLQSILHKHPFTQSNVKFPMVNVQKIHRPTKDIYAWKITVPVKALAV